MSTSQVWILLVFLSRYYCLATAAVSFLKYECLCLLLLLGSVRICPGNDKGHNVKIQRGHPCIQYLWPLAKNRNRSYSRYNKHFLEWCTMPFLQPMPSIRIYMCKRVFDFVCSTQFKVAPFVLSVPLLHAFFFVFACMVM